MNNIETDVLIVGGGPVGLSTALELRYQGINCILIEQSDGVVTDPKVSTVGPRSMELYRRWSISQHIRNAGWPVDHTLDVAWVTAVGGYEIYRVPFPSYAERSLPEYTPEPEQVCPQNLVAPVLMDALGQYPSGVIKLLCRLESFEQTDEEVVAKVTNIDSGNTEIIRAKYMVACDGARSIVRKACNVETPSFHPTQLFQSVVFNAPELASQLGSRNAMVFFLVNPKLQEPLRSVDGRGSYRLILKPKENGELRDPEEAVREAIAIDTPIEIVSNLKWYLTHRVADKFRQGRVFFAGDSAHTLSPSGGFGMNTGICDALDLGWKLAATLKGWGGEKLLDTYEMERRPIAVRNLEEANANLQRGQKRAVPPAITSDSPEGEAIRRSMAEGLERSNVKREFDAPGVHFGFRYESAIVIPDGTPPNSDPFQWTQNSYPGSRAPHAWLAPDKSILDLFGQGYVLLCFQEQQGTEAFAKACYDRRVPLTITFIEKPEIAQLYEKAYVLVRPDGHVAWRSDTLPSDPGTLIDRVRGYFS
ncbi:MULTISPECIES: FAD-dependent monooxygenase [Nostocales]|uniref:FAD-binding monooxygenase n=3 Tax=Nostocales TaxID=1161 RepID=A0A0C1QX70_9CYAN|nr:FAD-dependent monooxygenase [Tolypothrix bouteillei]KAF3885728.1 FAD-binding protein [Tolypothrix bouteillei VB521301]